MRICSLALLFLLVGCQQNGDLGPNTRTGPTSVTNPPAGTVTNPIVTTKIEFRVNGTTTTARIRYTNAVDGTTQVISSLPYITTINTAESSMFLTLEATPVSYQYNLFPFMSVQIFVNGVLFREAVSDSMSSPLSVAGTWRR